MAPNDDSSATDASIADPASSSVLRIVVLVVAAVAFCVAAWALIDGGGRDLWSPASRIGLFLPAFVPLL